MLNKLKLNSLILLFMISGTFPVNSQSVIPVSSYDFPYGYPFPVYPLEGASHSSLSNDYTSDPVYDEDIKRVSQYALRLLQTERAAEALEYVDEFLEWFPGYMDPEIWFIRLLSQSHLGQIVEAAESMSMAIGSAEILPRRFLAGSWRMFTSPHSHKMFISLWEAHKNDLVHGPMLGDMSDSGVRLWGRTVGEILFLAVIISPEIADSVISAPVLSRTEDGYMTEIVVEGLVPENRYYYDVPIGGEGQRFRTYPTEGESEDIDIFFSGGGGFTSSNYKWFNYPNLWVGKIID